MFEKNPEDYTEEEARRIIKPTADIFVRYLFTSKSNVRLTESFVNAVLADSGQASVKDITIVTPFCLADAVMQKETIMDIRGIDGSGKKIDIEIQNEVNGAFINRSLYYWAKIYSEQLKRRELFGELKPAVGINLLGESLPIEKVKRSDNFHWSFGLWDDKTRDIKLTDDCTIHYLELNKFHFQDFTENKDNCYTLLEDWLYFFKRGMEENFMEDRQHLAPEVLEAKKEYNKFIADESKRAAELSHEMWLHDQAQSRYDAVQQNKLETAKKMKTDKLDATLIAKYTGLPPEQIEKL